MIKEEYLRFLQVLSEFQIPEGVNKIANLVLEHLDTIQPLTTHQGQRVKKVVELAQDHWSELPDKINLKPGEASISATSITRLKNLKVGPFRGFARQEVFDLDSPLVLLYGPNGSGKSSFCEALEYGLLGNVSEAESKRISTQEYLKNVHVNNFESPVIEAIYIQGKEHSITANESLFRFCLVEKNRIENFSRIAAQLPARQTELISTLFGLDNFNEFVLNFTPEMDNRYIDLVGVKSQQLREKQLVLAGDQHIIKESVDEFLAIEQDETDLASQYEQGITFAQLISKLGNSETPGEIAAIDAELQQPLDTKTMLSVAALETKRQAIEINQTDLTAKETELAASSTELSFKQLYTAVSALGEVSKDQCPACKTPLNQTYKDPFELATQELAKLAHLSQLEQERDELNRNLTNAIKWVYQALKTCTERLSNDTKPNPLDSFLVQQETQITLEWWQSLLSTGADGFSAWQHLNIQIQRLEQMDNVIDQAQKQRTKRQARLTYLRELEKQMITLQTRRKSLEDSLQKAQKTIADFNEENKALIAKAEEEKTLIPRNQEIANSYAQFVTRLSGYKDDLPAKLVADLGDKVVELYNAFNRNDSPKDLLASIRLPLAQGQRLEIAFQTAPEKYFDALQILSEGHIRCLGLAILLAKNLKEACPLLIFDDPVNAIDDDHRESIRRTLFEDAFLEDKQIILTCHGEEFFKDIHNLLGAKKSALSRNFTFLPQLDEQHIRVDFDTSPRNYIIAAQNHVGKLQIRDALAKSRQALEYLTKNKVWRYVNSHGDGDLSIKMSSPKAPIELRNLTEQLKKKLAKADFTHENKEAVLKPIETLLGLGGDSREWRYLNKGTHEDSDGAEFDRVVVSTIVKALDDLDAALT